MKKKKWIIAPCDAQKSSELARICNLPALASRVLVARGVESKQQVEGFLDKSLCSIHDPFLLDDMDKAVYEIKAAINAGVKIAVYGDYDVDGVTATCILMKYLEDMDADSTYYIPDRINEGYGLNSEAIESLYEQGCRLLITVDSGITDLDEVRRANEIGMRVIVTDHHECKEELPDAAAVINPRRPNGRYPFRELAGVGVAFKLICALESHRSIEDLMAQYADIVAVGTIADVMPLRGENRVIVSQGLRYLQNTKNLGLRALMNKLGLSQKPVTSNSVSFIMAPRINAAGRLGGAARAARMFLAKDMEEAAALADQLCELNTMRQEEENRIYMQILEYIDQNPQLLKGSTLVLWGEQWHNGVIGIVASRLTDRFGMPSVLISMNGEQGKGSGRSIKGLNLYGALESCAPLLEKYGGHELAVGLSIDRENLQALRENLQNHVYDCEAGDETPSVQVDCKLTPVDLAKNEIKGLSVLEPFGMGNPQPIFAMFGVYVKEITPISRDRHMKMLLSKDGYDFYGFVFGMGSRDCPYVEGDVLDIAFSAEINSFRGKESVQLVLKDIVRGASEEEHDGRALEIYRAFCDCGECTKDEALFLCPSREDLVSVFRHVKANVENGQMAVEARTLYRRIRHESKSHMNLGRLLICLDVFSEFDIFTYDMVSDSLTVRLTDFTGKADINGSKILKQLILAAKG